MKTIDIAMRAVKAVAERQREFPFTPIPASECATLIAEVIDPHLKNGRQETKPKPSDDVGYTEDFTCLQAQLAISNCNWEIGKLARSWLFKFARGRTDEDFGAMIGLSGDQVHQRRRVWEMFCDARQKYERLKWSHFYAALDWEDADECLQWADDMQATVAEMKAWRRAQHGEDLSVPEKRK